VDLEEGITTMYTYFCLSTIQGYSSSQYTDVLDIQHPDLPPPHGRDLRWEMLSILGIDHKVFNSCSPHTNLDGNLGR
jgi:hypothetical protein